MFMDVHVSYLIAISIMHCMSYVAYILEHMRRNIWRSWVEAEGVLMPLLSFLSS